MTQWRWIHELSRNNRSNREWRKMSGKKPRVSIAVPVYNGENYLEYALEDGARANLCGF